MSVPKLDPRFNVDRVYEYKEYLQMREKFNRRKKAWYEFVPPRGSGRTRPLIAVRMLPYKLSVVAGMLLLLGALGTLSMLRADTAQLEYARQELSGDLSGLGQSVHESAAAVAAARSEVFAAGAGPLAEIGYPVVTNYVVLTNIPDATGKTLVAQLYPLSREIIRFEP